MLITRAGVQVKYTTLNKLTNLVANRYELFNKSKPNWKESGNGTMFYFPWITILCCNNILQSMSMRRKQKLKHSRWNTKVAIAGKRRFLPFIIYRAWVCVNAAKFNHNIKIKLDNSSMQVEVVTDLKCMALENDVSNDAQRKCQTTEKFVSF